MNSPFDDALIELQYHKPEVRDFWQPTQLSDQVDEGKVIQKALPKQTDLDKILKQINQKILQQTHFPAKLKDLQAAYLQSPHFHDIYQYLMSDKAPRAKKSRDKVLMDTQNYMILNTLLFKLVHEKIGDGKKNIALYPNIKNRHAA